MNKEDCGKHWRYLVAIANKELPLWIKRIIPPEEIIQEAYVRMLSHKTELNNTKTWLVTVVRNLCINTRRYLFANKRNIRQERSGLNLDYIPVQAEQEAIAKLNEAWSKLNKCHQEVLLTPLPDSNGSWRMARLRSEKIIKEII